MKSKEITIGQTKDVGWQFGLRKTFPYSLEYMWEFMFSENQMKLWLNGAEMEFSTFKHNSHIRTKWKLNEWKNEATLQMRLIAVKDKTTIAFHIDRLLNENQRVETKNYWGKVMKIMTERIPTNR